jgi:hypothetical protein
VALMDEPDRTGDAIEDTTDWRELREFRGVDLDESFVLSWRIEGGSLRLDVDLCLLPQHPFYETPRPSRRACYHAGIVEFPACSALDARNRDGAARPPSQVANELGLGRITGLKRTSDGVYEIHGAFGEVEVRSDRPLLRLKSGAA